MPAKACRGNNTCEEGYARERCSECADGWYRSKQLCKECGVLASVPVIFLLLSLVLAPAATLVNSQSLLRRIKSLLFEAERGS